MPIFDAQARPIQGWEILQDDVGVRQCDTEIEANLVSALNIYVEKKTGGVKELTAEEYGELKKKLNLSAPPVNPLPPRGGQTIRIADAPELLSKPAATAKGPASAEPAGDAPAAPPAVELGSVPSNILPRGRAPRVGKPKGMPPMGEPAL